MVWHLPYGNYILYPFTILTTWLHEMSHGLCALLLGGIFNNIDIYPDGSGLAYYGFTLPRDNLKHAFVASGGTIEASVLGALLVVSSGYCRLTKVILILMGYLMSFSVIYLLSSLFGIIAISILAISTLGIAFFGAVSLRQFLVQVFGIMSCVGVYREFPCLFTKSVLVNGKLLLSDTEQIAQALFFPYWFWGSLIVLTSVGLLLLSLAAVYYRK